MRPVSEPEQSGILAPLPGSAVDALAGTESPPPRHVIHLPVAVTSVDRALRFAYALARSLALVPGIEVAGTTVSAEDAQHVRHWVFCDRIMPDRSRCVRRADHEGPCDPARPG